MAEILGKRHGHKARHKTVTEAASKVYQVLLKAGFIPYPGVIKRGAGPILRITVSYEPTRIRLKISSKATQELSLYGEIDKIKLESTLRELCPELVVRSII